MARKKKRPIPTDGIPQRLQVARKAAGLTQQAVADRLGVRVNTVARWEAGGIRLTVDRLVSLAKLYHVGIASLTLGNDKRAT